MPNLTLCRAAAGRLGSKRAIPPVAVVQPQRYDPEEARLNG
jgi:hypothetical protein